MVAPMTFWRNAAAATRLLARAKELRALTFGEFTLSSGQKSSYYFDGRLLSLDPNGLQEIAEALLPIVRDAGALAIGGPTLGADPIVGGVVLLSGQRGHGIAGFLVRSQVKQHGTGRQIEGPLQKGTPVAIVDDTVSTGGNLLMAIDAVQEFGCKVVTTLCVLDRKQGGSEELRRRGIPFFRLWEADVEGKIRVVADYQAA